MKWLVLNIRKVSLLLSGTLFFLAIYWSCTKDDELKYDIQSKEIIFAVGNNNLFLLGGIDVNQLELFEVMIQAKDINNNSVPAEIEVSSIPNDGNNPLPEIKLKGGVTSEGKFTASLSDLGIETLNHKATLKFFVKFNDGENVIRTFQVRPKSPFQYNSPTSVFAVIDNISNIEYNIDAGKATINTIKIEKKVNDGSVSEITGEWESEDEIPIQGSEYNAGDNIYIRIETSSQNATVVSEWIKVPVLRPEGQFTYLFEDFFEGTPEAGFTDGCWAGVQGGKSFVNTIFNYDGASGGTGAFDADGWNTLYTHIANTPIVAFSGLVSGNYSSNSSAVGKDKDLLTPLFDMSNTKDNKLIFYYLCKASGEKVNHLKILVTSDNVVWTEVADLAEQTVWVKKEFDLPSNTKRIKFTGISGGANKVDFNTYIDDIKVFGEF